MKKNILIVILSLLCGSLIIYCKIKTGEAERFSEMSIAIKEVAEQQRKRANESTAMARAAQEEAERIMMELIACQSK